MIVAITSTGNTIESSIDPRFGRCAFFVLYDTESKEIFFHKNPYKEVEEAAGVSVVDWLSQFSCSKIVSGEFGSKIKHLLDEQQIQMIILKNPKRKIKEMVGLLNH